MSTDAIVGLRAIHADLQAVLTTVTAEEWEQESGCTGWSVKDVLAHVTSNFKEMVEPTPPASEPLPEMTAEEAMEALVAPRKEWTAEELLAEYERYRDGVFAALAGMQTEPTASTVVPLADLGMYPLHWLANAYCFDHYCHLRHDLLAPAGPLVRELAAPDDAMVRPGVDWMWAGLPQMCSRDLAPVVTAPLKITLTGAGGGTWIIGPAGEDGLVTVTETEGDAAAEVRSSAHDFVAWGTKRSDWRSACELAGDADYAAAVLDALNII